MIKRILYLLFTFLLIASCGTSGPSQEDTSEYPNVLETTISVGNGPRDICISSDGCLLYVANFQSNTVSVINTESNSVVASIEVPSGPNGIAITPDNSFVYVTCMNANTVAVIQTSDNSIVESIPSNGQGTRRLCILPTGDFVYVANYISCNIDVISTTTNTIVTSLDFGNWPEGITCNSDGSEVYCLDSGTGSTATGTLGVIRTADNTFIEVIEGFDGSPAICYIANTQCLYAGNWHWQNAYVIDLNTYTIIDSIPTANNAYNFKTTPSGNFSVFDGSLRIVDTSDHSIKEDLSSARDFFGIAFSPNGSQMYAACPSENLVYVWVTENTE